MSEMTEEERQRLMREADEVLAGSNVIPIAGAMGGGLSPSDPLHAALHPAPLTLDEMTGASLTPRSIVDDYLFADLSVLAGEGGMGKSTIALYEAIHVAIGAPLWGHEIASQGHVAIVTDEDSREQVAARLYRLAQGLDLSEAAIRRLAERIIIIDAQGTGAKLAESVSGTVVVTPFVDHLIEALQDKRPSLLLVDPLASFSPPESSVNDGLQGVVNAGRRLFRALDCCVRLVHHVPKTSGAHGGRDVWDQYFMRGGTALPNGCRIITNLGAAKQGVPEELAHIPGRAMVLASPKVSYSDLYRVPPVWIKREGWRLHWAPGEWPWAQAGEDLEKRAQEDELVALRFMQKMLDKGQKLTKTGAKEQHALSGLPRARLVAAIGRLIADGRLKDVELPVNERHGSRKYYLKPTVKVS